MNNNTTNNTIDNADNAVMDLTTVEGIQVALAANEGNKVLVGILEALLAAKKREVELIEKAAKSGNRSKLTNTEQVIKSMFVALRPHVIDTESPAVRAFKGAVDVLDIEFDKKLQETCFSSSVLHCGKSNLNKSKSVYESLSSYKEAATQAKILLPLIEDGTWKEWESSMYTIAKNVVIKRKETWKEPEAETVPAETVPAETVPAETVPAAADKKKVVITTRKNGKKK